MIRFDAVTLLKRILPSPSYSITLPKTVCQERDDRITSFWLDGHQGLLQLSSYLRADGNQLSAQQRLRERTDKNPAGWQFYSTPVHPDPTIDQATAEILGDDGVLWVHMYLVWSHLTVYALVSGPPTELRAPNNWAMSAVKSIELAVH